MRRSRLAPILAAALLFILVAHHHPVSSGPAANPCSVCVHQTAAELGVAAEVAAPASWLPFFASEGNTKADAETVAAITRGPPTA
jgi:hypothetical protein